MLNQFDDGVVHALGMDALVFRTSPLGQGVERRLQRRSAFGVEDAVDRKHAIRHQADVEAAAQIVLLRLTEEAVRVGGMPRHSAEHAEVKDREPARVVEHLLFVEEISLLAELVAQVAEDRGRLIADLPRAQSGGDLRHRLQLFADAEPVGG